jgi:hypothetical protein
MILLELDEILIPAKLLIRKTIDQSWLELRIKLQDLRFESFQGKDGKRRLNGSPSQAPGRRPWPIPHHH